MERIILDSWDERLGLAFLMIGVRGRIRSKSHEMDHVEATSRLITVEHQYAGYSCAHEQVTGVIFRVEDAPAHRDVKRLLGGIGSISEQPAPPEYPVDRRFQAFGYTFGEELPAKAVSDVFMGYLPIPPFTRAWEAFAESVPVDPKVLSEWFTWSPDGPGLMDDELLDQLVAAAAISRQPLGLYLLWSNSD
ncbi:MAG: hypothetical protein GQE15_33650 [Archangiaceae bacterium]|nr:hypothetical protein [Archangiaceae bacterium]